MIKNKKGIESYLFLLLFVSFFMSVLLYFILGIVYKQDPEICNGVALVVQNECLKGNTINFLINNENNGKLEFEINGVFDDSYVVERNVKKEFSVPIQGKNINIIPRINSIIKIDYCNQKTYSINERNLKKC